MLIQKEFDLSKPFTLTEEQEKMLDDLKNRPIIIDEDCPEYTDEEFARMRRRYFEKAEAGEIKFPLYRTQKRELTPEQLQVLKEAFDEPKEIKESDHARERRKGA